MASNPVQGQGIVGRTKPTVRGNLGKYNHVKTVGNSETFFATGSNEAAAFIVGNTDTVLTFSGGGSVAGTAFNTKEIVEIGIQKVVNGGSGVVYLLR
tara:strand:+ start:444 stop:734 length:291 start_codon:yes stop_codon:yes gene_type:complete